jgi:hypothetical protein
MWLKSLITSLKREFGFMYVLGLQVCNLIFYFCSGDFKVTFNPYGTTDNQWSIFRCLELACSELASVSYDISIINTLISEKRALYSKMFWSKYYVFTYLIFALHCGTSLSSSYYYSIKCIIICTERKSTDVG